MVRTPAAAARQQERAERRRTQVLDAAQNCVRIEGFHAASMSRIAAEAGMSAGHIYKYFENKEAIMIALTERRIDEFMRHITELSQSPSPDIDLIVETYLREVPDLLDHDRSALVLEVYAEAARNPKVAEMVSRVNMRFRDTMRKIIEPVLKGCPEREIDKRVEMLLVLTQALPLHAGTQQEGDHDMIAEGLALTIRGILTPPR